MKILSKLFLVLFLTSFYTLSAQKLPSKKAILNKMTVANAYFMQKWPDVSKPIWQPDKTRPSNIWTRAVYYEGLMALYQLKPEKEYLKYMVEWGEKHKWGLRNGVKTRNADDQACGQIYLELHQMDAQPERIADIKTNIDNMLATDKKDDWCWIDALQMAMPVYTRLAILNKDNRYYEKMYELYDFAKNQHGGKGLFNPQDDLWWRDKDFVPPYKSPNGEDCYWSRGNGWVLAALVRVLDIMPGGAPHREEYVDMYHKMVKALVKVQRPDGFWNVSLHDPNEFGGKELTGTALFTYGMAWGVRKGLLDKKAYIPIISKAWKGMAEAVHSNGFLGYVQGTGKEPKDGQPVNFDKVPNFEDFGLGCFLLAGAEVYKLK